MEHLIVNLGLILLGAGVLSILFKLFKQSNIIAFILVGIIAALFKKIEMPKELMEAFTETGIILLLFMAGLEVDIKSFLKRWKLVLFNGIGQIILNTIAGMALGLIFLGIKSPSVLIYFGLCLTFSSTIIVLGFLKSSKQMESLHGQIILGLMVLQDITAVIALAILKSIASNAPLFTAIFSLIIKMIIIAVILGILSKFVFVRLFRWLAKSSETLFVGTLGYALGLAAICEIIHFSPEIGAFMAGVSLGVLPYKLEIEDKVEPLKSFGVILFFVSLGYNLKFSSEILHYIIPIVACLIIIVFGTPVLMLILGWTTRLKSRPAFLIGGIINQISEFSLILATLCLEAKLFNQQIFLIITLSCLGTIFLSSLGHPLLHKIYTFFKPSIKFIDSHGLKTILLEDFKMEDHIVIFNYNELSEEFIKYFKEHHKRVLLIDLDPDVCHYLTKKEKKKDILPLYADIYDPDTWEEAHLHKASLVISCMIDGQEAEIAICRWLKEHNAETLFIAATDSSVEALELYNAGTRFVIQTEYLASLEFKKILENEMKKGTSAFIDIREEHKKIIEQKKTEMKELFYTV